MADALDELPDAAFFAAMDDAGADVDALEALE